jgi:hypothetical protein
MFQYYFSETMLDLSVKLTDETGNPPRQGADISCVQQIPYSFFS